MSKLVPCPMCGAAISPNAVACPQCGEAMRGGIGGGAAGGFWRDGNTLVFSKGAHFPNRCVKSNVPTDRQLTRNLAWYPQWLWLLLILTGPLIFIIVALCLQKKARVEIGLSDEWFGKRTRATLLGWGSVVIGILVIIVGANSSAKDGTPTLIVILGIVIGVVGAIIGLMTARIVFPKKITDTHVWLGGVGPEFLGEYPQWHGGQ